MDQLQIKNKEIVKLKMINQDLVARLAEGDLVSSGDNELVQNLKMIIEKQLKQIMTL